MVQSSYLGHLEMMSLKLWRDVVAESGIRQ